MFGCIDVNQPTVRSPKVWHIPPGTSYTYVYPIFISYLKDIKVCLY